MITRQINETVIFRPVRRRHFSQPQLVRYLSLHEDTVTVVLDLHQAEPHKING